MPESRPVRVVIFDQPYTIRPADDAGARQVQKLAEYVDSHMRSVAAQTRDVDSLRIAVLAALHIADEYHSLKERYDKLRSAVDAKSEELATLLDSELRKSLSD